MIFVSPPSKTMVKKEDLALWLSFICAATAMWSAFMTTSIALGFNHKVKEALGGAFKGRRCAKAAAGDGGCPCSRKSE